MKTNKATTKVKPAVILEYASPSSYCSMYVCIDMHLCVCNGVMVVAVSLFLVL